MGELYYKPKSKSPYRYESVMIIDPDETSGFRTGEIIKAKRFAKFVHIHSNVESAILCLKCMAELKHSYKVIPNYIFLDLNFPTKSGLDFLREFQNLPAVIKTVNLVLLVREIKSEERILTDYFKQIRGYLLKPLKRSQLASLP